MGMSPLSSFALLALLIILSGIVAVGFTGLTFWAGAKLDRAPRETETEAERG